MQNKNIPIWPNVSTDLISAFKYQSQELDKLKNVSNMIQRMQNNTIERIKKIDKQIKLNHAKAKEI